MIWLSGVGLNLVNLGGINLFISIYIYIYISISFTSSGLR